jgi:hypothetical protein
VGDSISVGDADRTTSLGFVFYFYFPSANKPQEHKSGRSTKPHRLLASNVQFGNQCFIPCFAVMAGPGILKNCRHRHFTSELHHLIDTVEFTVICLFLFMHDIVIHLAEISITVIYFSPCYSDPKYLGSLRRLEVLFWFKGDYLSRHDI